MERLNSFKKQVITFNSLIGELKERYLIDITIMCFCHKEDLIYIYENNVLKTNNISFEKNGNISFKDQPSTDMDKIYKLLFFILQKTESCFAAYIVKRNKNHKQELHSDSFIAPDFYNEKSINENLYDTSEVFQNCKSDVFYLSNYEYVVYGNNYDNLINKIDRTENCSDKKYDNFTSQCNNFDDYHYTKEGNELSLKERQDVAYDLLCYFDDICRKNSIFYSLAGGTLLGAIRHSDFIPWDDDADVFMARPEYNKFLTSFIENDTFYIKNFETDNDYNYVYTRMIDKRTKIIESDSFSGGYGAYLDICVVDGLPNNIFLRILHILYLRLLFRVRRTTLVRTNKGMKHNLKYYIKVLVSCFFNTKQCNKMINNTISKYSFNNSKYVANMISQYGIKEILLKRSFDLYFETKFRDRYFMVFSGYDIYLKKIYHDYLKYPKAEKRVGHHNDRIVWL